MKNLILVVLALTLASCVGRGTKTAEQSGEEAIEQISKPAARSYENGSIMAAEWSDLQNWDFFKGLTAQDEYREMLALWGIYPYNRVSAQVWGSTDEPFVNAPVTLVQMGMRHASSVGNNIQTVAAARTDVGGRAELWPLLFRNNRYPSYEKMALQVHGLSIPTKITPVERGVLEARMPGGTRRNTRDIAFVADPASSMEGEMQWLDTGAQTMGTGETPGPLRMTLENAIAELEWKGEIKLLFWLADTAPSRTPEALDGLHTALEKAIAAGIRIIPVVPAAADISTQFLARLLALTSGGTCIFIPGDGATIPAIGDYTSEPLNSLITKAISRYTE